MSELQKWDESQISLIKSQIAPGVTDEELALFAQVCANTGLDPFARQIYAIKRKSKENRNGVWTDIEKMTIQTSIDGYRAIADRTGRYAGSETFWCGQDGVWLDVWLSTKPPAAAKTLIYKTGSDKPFVGVARFDSYKQTKSGGQLTAMWERMSDLLIGKCSEALALRKAFPSQLSGLYTTEEMGQADTIHTVDVAVSNNGSDRTALENEVAELVKTLGFTAQQASAFIAKNFPGKSKRSQLSVAELKDLLELLQLSTSDDSAKQSGVDWSKVPEKVSPQEVARSADWNPGVIVDAADWPSSER